MAPPKTSGIEPKGLWFEGTTRVVWQDDQNSGIYKVYMGSLQNGHLVSKKVLFNSQESQNEPELVLFQEKKYASWYETSGKKSQCYLFPLDPAPSSPFLISSQCNAIAAHPFQNSLKLVWHDLSGLVVIADFANSLPVRNEVKIPTSLAGYNTYDSLAFADSLYLLINDSHHHIKLLRLNSKTNTIEKEQNLVTDTYSENINGAFFDNNTLLVAAADNRRKKVELFIFDLSRKTAATKVRKTLSGHDLNINPIGSELILSYIHDLSPENQAVKVAAIDSDLNMKKEISFYIAKDRWAFVPRVTPFEKNKKALMWNEVTPAGEKNGHTLFKDPQLEFRILP